MKVRGPCAKHQTRQACRGIELYQHTNLTSAIRVIFLALGKQLLLSFCKSACIITLQVILKNITVLKRKRTSETYENCKNFLAFLGAFVKLRKATINFMSVRPPTKSNSTPKRLIFKKVCI